MWTQGAVPQEFKDASVVHFYKRKGNRQACDNHRGISLLCIAGKILVRIFLNRLIGHLGNGLLPESQCGFRKERGAIDMVFAARQLQEKCQEQNVDLYTTFVDLTKAFDTVSRSGLWSIMNAFQDSDPDINIRYRADDKLFNLRCLQAKTKIYFDKLHDFLFADDCALNASSPEDMQYSMDLFFTACINFGLMISTKKTEVMYQPAPGKQYREPTVTVNKQKLAAVDKFTYLGSALSRSVHIDDETDARIAKASVAFGRLRSSV
ncbi:uncharacterized protein LOC134767492 [Penaeus indicus]|uniref:uncharacterized protein LOC134767492 n=1 Tax=Penaeus indicus TaxID=29960 RepID=UPI00300D873F